MYQLPGEDVSVIANQTAALWEQARGARLLITGGTGFFGIWLLESLCYINREYGLNISATVLSRDPQNFLLRFPFFAGREELHFLKGDVKDFAAKDLVFDYVIHGATEASARMINEAPLQMYSTICNGTQNILDMVVKQGCKRFLYLSSGAVYGDQPPTISHVMETYTGGPDSMKAGAVYSEAKRMGENLCAIYAHSFGLNFSSARCYAFVGPHLPLDSHFAIGNFLRDVLMGRDIKISADGTPLRSYLYAGDLCVWLWTILFRGQNYEAYNVGSENALSIKELAEAVVRVSGCKSQVRVALEADPSKAPKRYVPSTLKARTQLGLMESVSLDIAIAKTLNWHRHFQT